MSKKTKIILCLVGTIVLFFLSYSCFKWYSYKSKYTVLQKALGQSCPKQEFSSQEFLTPIDCMVLSGDEGAYQKCNTENSIYFQGKGDSLFSRRDYMLYCYIFAIRDGNSRAATEFVSDYLFDIDNGGTALDTAMLKEIERLSLRVIHDTSSYGGAMAKFLVAVKLKELYNGSYSEEFKDTVLYQQYCDTVSKYSKLF